MYRPHTEEFKQEAVRIALTSGLPRDRVLREEREVLKNGRGFGPPVRGRNGLWYDGRRRVAAVSLLVA